MEPTLRAAYEPSKATKRGDTATEYEALRILSINCGGLGPKLPRLIALLGFSDSDIVCLQEAGSALPLGIGGLPYQAWYGVPVAGGGLATLVHHRCIHDASQRFKCRRNQHHLIVSIQLTHALHLTLANAHLPPGLTSAVRNGIMADISTSLASAPVGLKVLCGDLNDELPPRRSAWLHGMLSPPGLLGGYRSPYPHGEPTNFVLTPNQGGMAHPSAHPSALADIGLALIA